MGFMLGFLVLMLSLLLLGSMLMGIFVGRRRLGLGLHDDSLRHVQDLARQQALLKGLNPLQAAEYQDSMTIGICFSRFALQVAYADGMVTQSEIMGILHFFRNADPALVNQIQEILFRDMTNPGSIDWEYNLQEARRILAQPRWQGFMPILFDGLVRISLADGRSSESELSSIFSIMSQLGWTHSQTTSWFQNQSGFNDQAYAGNSPQSEQTRAREILGLNASAGPDEIKKRYRELVREHHPDRYAQMGEEMQRSATTRFQTIQKAYETLSLSR
jgi:DnaJ like chaperone protein